MDCNLLFLLIYFWGGKLVGLDICTELAYVIWYTKHVSLLCNIHLSQQFTDWIGLSSVLRLRQHSIGHMGDGFYGSKDPTNSIKVLKEHIIHREQKNTIIAQITKNTANPLVYTNIGWLGDGSHRGQVRHAWTAGGRPPRYPPPTTVYRSPT